MTDETPRNPNRALIQCGWRHSAHLSQEDIERMKLSTPPQLLDARMNGNPTMGAGAVYPINRADFEIPPFQIPNYYKRLAGLDVGYNVTACIFGALDTDTDILYVYDEYVGRKQNPATNASGIRHRTGDWMPIMIDPASRGRSQTDGTKLILEYRKEGLDVRPADNAVEAGIFAVWQRLSSGRLKVFKTCTNLLAEHEIYQRDKDGKVRKEDDHCLHPDTKVITDKGVFRIEDLVGTSGKVLSIDGKYENYVNCRKTATDKETVELLFSDGTKVTCTPDHKFLTKSGWKQACELLGENVVYITTTIQKEDTTCKSQLSAQQSKSLKVNGITSAATTFKEKVYDSIALCGQNTTNQKSQKGFMSTILTKTNQIIRQKIFNFFTVVNTCVSITKESLSHYLSMHYWQQQSGTVQRKEGIGTNNITRNLSIFFMPLLTLIVNIVKSFRTTFCTLNFAPITANLPLAGHRELILSRDNASLAKQNLKLTSTAKQQTVQEAVELKCLSVRKSLNSDVYCLEVPTTHAFAIEGGIIVHNCEDGLRYLVQGLAHAKLKYLSDPYAGYTYTNPYKF